MFFTWKTFYIKSVLPVSKFWNRFCASYWNKFHDLGTTLPAFWAFSVVWFHFVKFARFQIYDSTAPNRFILKHNSAPSQSIYLNYNAKNYVTNDILMKKHIEFQFMFDFVCVRSLLHIIWKHLWDTGKNVILKEISSHSNSKVLFSTNMVVISVLTT